MYKKAVKFIKSKSSFQIQHEDLDISIDEILSALDNIQDKLEYDPKGDLCKFNLQFTENYCRIEYFKNGESEFIQDKGSNLKEALLKVVFELYQKFDKKTPSKRIRTDDSFLLED
jgi:hypothetical protein